MLLEDIILFLFAVYGLQNILSIGKPTKPLRILLALITGGHSNALFKCPLCLGFWCGFMVFGTFHLPVQVKLWIMAPLVGAGVCYFFHNLTYFATMGGEENVSVEFEGTQHPSEERESK